jgi:hypothetical protein
VIVIAASTTSLLALGRVLMAASAKRRAPRRVPAMSAASRRQGRELHPVQS